MCLQTGQYAEYFINTGHSKRITYAYYKQQEYPISVAAGENTTYSTVKTPNGTSVEVITFSPDYTSAGKADINTYYDALYPSAERQRSATFNYNCHSYAWYSQATTNRYWMNQ